jgi:hypothetical protein
MALNEETDDSTELAEIVEWLRLRPQDAILSWGDMHVMVQDVHTGWVDVVICEAYGAEDAPKYHWFWTIDGPPDARDEFATPLDERSDTIITLDYDAALWRTWDHSALWWRDEPVVRTDASATELTADQLALFAGSTEEPIANFGWSTGHIDRALTAWCAKYAERGDLTFAYDPKYFPGGDERADELDNLADAILSGEAPSYEIADGIRVSDQVMDLFLSQDPTDAAELSNEIVTRLSRVREQYTDDSSD